jgi:arginyl-tRNA--protein-N-Asp/Glu arginylyltransferase
MPYLSWDQKTITNFSNRNVNALYNEGYVFTRLGKGIMQQTRSLRVDLSKLKLSSENRRVLRKADGNLNMGYHSLPYQNYSWEIGKLGKDFYGKKFGPGTFSANKIKELLTNSEKSNFNTLLTYSQENEVLGFCVAYQTTKMLHYSYPFYSAGKKAGLGMMMMTKAVLAAKNEQKKYVYLGSAQRPTDKYKFQFSGLEWFDGKKWNSDLNNLKKIL